jgi:outer membrane protein OmpA-like peptidoglycan-associated protein
MHHRPLHGGRAEIRPSFYEVLNSVVLVLDEYDETIIEVLGHTDSTGSDAARRAHPISDDATPEGRQANRRVELRLVPLTA